MLTRDRRTLLVFTLVAMIASILALSTPMASAEVGDPNGISGTVTRPSLNPARGILVTGELDGGGDSFSVVTDSSGVYSAVGLTPGNWTLKFEDLDNKTLATTWWNGGANGAASEAGATPIVVTDGLPSDGNDLQLLRGAAANGVVSDSSGGVVPATVELYLTSNLVTPVESLTADADGGYRFRGLWAGTYRVRAIDPIFGVDEWFGGGVGTDIVLGVGSIIGGNGITLSGGRITGSVVDGAAPAGGIPVTFNGVGQVFSGTDGTFTSPFLDNDTYTVAFGGLAPASGGNGVAGGVTDIGATNIAGADAITGTVTAATGGAPLSGVNVTVTNGAYTAMTETAADGTYAAYAPTGGGYTVDFTTPNFVDDLANPASSPSVVDAALTSNPGASGPPEGTSIQTNGVAVNGLPRISGFAGPRVTHEDCPGGTGEILLDDGVNTWGQQMDEIDPGDYRVKLPQVSTIGLAGTTTITITITCPSLAVEITEFQVYIDPAGRVFDTNGVPVFAATVTLWRDDPSTGVVDFAIVPAGSAVMDPAINSVNPDVTDASGFWRWELAPGTYKVSAEKEGCHAPGDEGTLIVETSPFTAQDVGLRITMECPPPPLPETPDDNPPVAPGTDCPSVGALDPFVDVPSTSFADKDVTCIFQLNVTTGTSATTYSPADFVTREQMASFLARLYTALTGGMAPVVPTPFADLGTASQFAVDDIARIYGLGVTTGTTPTTYAPKDLVTREQMASFLARLFKAVTATDAPAVPTPFVDVDADSFARLDIGRIYGLEVTTGTSANMYSPDDFVTREQMASFLARLFRAAGGEIT